MKNFIYTISNITFVTIMSLCSCTDLEEEVFSEIPIEKFFQTEKDVLMNAGRAYTKLQSYPVEFSLWTLNELASDEMVAPGRDDGFVWDNGRWDEIHTHNLTPNNKILTWAWNFVFEGISACNEVIFETEQTEISFPEKDRIVSEIKILRAFFYYWGMDNWGNIPFSIDFTDKNLSEQKNRQFIYEYIEDEIFENIDDLQADNDPSYYGRVTKGMAYTLLAKLYLNAEEWIGADKYQQAIDACDKVIALNNYGIENDYFSNFNAHNESSVENIFVIPLHPNFTWKKFYWFTLTLNDDSRATFGFKGQMWDEFVVVPGFLDKYADNDLRKKSFLFGQQKDRDGNDILVKGVPFIYTTTIDDYMARKKWEGARGAKYEYELDKLDYQATNMDNDFVLFRYADVLYTKLEALWRLGRAKGMLSDPDLQKIRTRAGLPPLQSSDLTDAELLDELAREFAWEGHRRQDMIRFGVWGNAWWQKPESGPNAKLFPIPQEVLTTNSNLVQNPK